MRGRLFIINNLCKNNFCRRAAVIRLLSGFPVLLASLTAHVRITLDIFDLSHLQTGSQFASCDPDRKASTRRKRLLEWAFPVVAAKTMNPEELTPKGETMRDTVTQDKRLTAKQVAEMLGVATDTNYK
jgi:hypothetical protein